MKHHLLEILVGKAMVSNGRNQTTAYAGGPRKVSQCTVVILNHAVIFVNGASFTQDLVHAANKQRPEFKYMQSERQQ